MMSNRVRLKSWHTHTHTHTHTRARAFVCRHFNTNRRGSLHDVCVACGTNYGYDGVRVFVEQTERGCRGSKAGAWCFLPLETQASGHARNHEGDLLRKFDSYSLFCALSIRIHSCVAVHTLISWFITYAWQYPNIEVTEINEEFSLTSHKTSNLLSKVKQIQENILRRYPFFPDIYSQITNQWWVENQLLNNLNLIYQLILHVSPEGK